MSGCSSGVCLNTRLHIANIGYKELFNCHSLISPHRKKLLEQMGRTQLLNHTPSCILFPNNPTSKSHQTNNGHTSGGLPRVNKNTTQPIRPADEIYNVKIQCSRFVAKHLQR